MSVTSGRTSPPPFAFYDPDSHCLRTSQGTFGEDSTSSSPTLPPSGSMRAGALYAHRMSALHTAVNGCSSSPGLPTPTARNWKGQGYDGQLPNAVSLLPTPRASDTGTPGRRASEGWRPPLSQVLLPPPRATDGTKGGTNQRGSSGDLMLPSAVHQLLPTPTAMDSRGARNATARRSAIKANTNDAGWTLCDVFWTGDRTSPPSADGNTPPAAPPPGQLSLDELASD